MVSRRSRNRITTGLLWVAAAVGAALFVWGYNDARSTSFRASTIVAYQNKIISLYETGASPKSIGRVQADLGDFQARMPLPDSNGWRTYRLLVGFWVCLWAVALIRRSPVSVGDDARPDHRGHVAGPVAPSMDG